MDRPRTDKPKGTNRRKAVAVPVSANGHVERGFSAKSPALAKGKPAESALDIPPELAALHRLRQVKVRPERDLTLTKPFASEEVALRKLRRANGGLVEAWASVAPGDLADQIALRGVSAGVATLAVTNASARYQLDRWLRSGGERELIRACRAPIRKVKVVIEQAETRATS